MMIKMRTTVNLEDDLAERLREMSHSLRCSFTEVLNNTLRQSLRSQLPETAEPYKTIPWNGGLVPGIDPTSMNHLADELEDEEIIRKLRLGR